MITANAGVCAFESKQMAPGHGLSGDRRNKRLDGLRRIGVEINQRDCFRAGRLPEHVLNGVVLDAGNFHGWCSAGRGCQRQRQNCKSLHRHSSFRLIPHHHRARRAGCHPWRGGLEREMRRVA